jgi:hypothetical protein
MDPHVFQIHDDKFHTRIRRTAKQHGQQNKRKQKKLSELSDTAVLEPDMATIGQVGLLEEEEEEGSTVVYLQMVPDLDLSLSNDIQE